MLLSAPLHSCAAAGKRKSSIARVWVMPGVGKFRVNSRSMTEYFPALVRRMDVLKPFEVSGTLGHFDVMSTVRGGGNTGDFCHRSDYVWI